MTSSGEEPAKAESPESAGDSAGSSLSAPRDPSLPHQPILDFGHNGEVVLSCNCRWNVTTYGPMGTVANRYQTQRLYNDPANHRIPFGHDDEIHYKDVEPWSR